MRVRKQNCNFFLFPSFSSTKTILNCDFVTMPDANEAFFVKNTFLCVRSEAPPPRLLRSGTYPIEHGNLEAPPVSADPPVFRREMDASPTQDSTPLGNLADSSVFPRGMDASPTQDSPPPEGSAAAFPSQARALHDSGKCVPCGFVHKATGCYKGDMCQFCHFCDRNAYHIRKRLRQKMAKENRKAKAEEKRAW